MGQARKVSNIFWNFFPSKDCFKDSFCQVVSINAQVAKFKLINAYILVTLLNELQVIPG